MASPISSVKSLPSEVLNCGKTLQDGGAIGSLSIVNISAFSPVSGFTTPACSSSFPVMFIKHYKLLLHYSKHGDVCSYADIATQRLRGMLCPGVGTLPYVLKYYGWINIVNDLVVVSPSL